MAYTYEDNENAALEIVKGVRGEVLSKWKGKNQAACMILPHLLDLWMFTTKQRKH